jgi:hypothetical protein
MQPDAGITVRTVSEDRVPAAFARVTGNRTPAKLQRASAPSRSALSPATGWRRHLRRRAASGSHFCASGAKMIITVTLANETSPEFPYTARTARLISSATPAQICQPQAERDRRGSQYQGGARSRQGMPVYGNLDTACGGGRS